MLQKNFYEHLAWEKDLYVCGIDEAGRGCLSGPLVTAAVVLPRNTTNNLLRDSKIMSEEQREIAYRWITRHCFYSYVTIAPAIIDQKNIYQATRFSMKKAFMQLIHALPFDHEKLFCLITDAVPISLAPSYKHSTLQLFNPTHAESLSQTVAAASIVAKVTRDHLMSHFAKLFPNFATEQHKGYGTSTHMEKIKTHGTSIIHRTSFLSNIVNRDSHEQQTIC